MNSGGLGARERGKSQGNGRGGRGVFVGTSMEGDKGLYAGLLRGIAGDAALLDLWRGRRRRRQRLRRVWLTGGSRLSVAGKKKNGARARRLGLRGLLRLLACARLAGLAQLGLARLACSNFFE